jgi:hypothetical protein
MIANSALLDNSLIAGVFLTLAGLSGLARHFLLEPQTASYPKAPVWLNAVVFMFASVLIFLGLRFLAAFATGAEGIPPNAGPTMALLSVFLAAYKISMLVNVLRQRLPSGTWARLNRITDSARCR